MLRPRRLLLSRRVPWKAGSRAVGGVAPTYGVHYPDLRAGFVGRQLADHREAAVVGDVLQRRQRGFEYVVLGIVEMHDAVALVSSEESRVGKRGVSNCQAGGVPFN